MRYTGFTLTGVAGDTSVWEHLDRIGRHMGKLLSYLKAAAGEAPLHSKLGIWRQKVSAAADAMSAAGVGSFNWAESATFWQISSSEDILDAAVTHTSSTGRVRVMLQVFGYLQESANSVVGRLLIDGVEYPKPRFSVLPNTSESKAGFSGWWIIDTDEAPHIYMPRIVNGGVGVFTVDPTDDFQHMIILSTEDVGV